MFRHRLTFACLTCMPGVDFVTCQILSSCIGFGVIKVYFAQTCTHNIMAQMHTTTQLMQASHLHFAWHISGSDHSISICACEMGSVILSWYQWWAWYLCMLCQIWELRTWNTAEWQAGLQAVKSKVYCMLNWLRPVACGWSVTVVSWHATSFGQFLVEPIVHVYVVVTLIADLSTAALEQ